MSFFRCLDRLTALVPDGCLLVKYYLRLTGPAPGSPSDDRYRFGANELLRVCLDLTVLHYDEATEDPPPGTPAPRHG